LRRAVEELAELFGDQIPTSTFRLKSNRKKYWTSEKMKPAKFLAAFEKELKKGNLDKVIGERMGIMTPVNYINFTNYFSVMTDGC
jgi:hypothetical protein